MIFALDMVQLVCVIILFAVTIIQAIGLRRKTEDIEYLNTQLDTLEMNISRQEVKMTEEMLKSNTEILPILVKIQRNYAVTKSDKLKLLNFLFVLMRGTDANLLSKVNISKAFTYKQATECILNYIEKPQFTDTQIINVLNAIYFLITK